MKISVDVLAYWKRTGYRPYPSEKLTMIWNHWKCPLEKKLEYMRSFVEPYEGRELDLWEENVRIRLEWEEQKLKEFQENKNGEYIYRVSYYEPADREYQPFCDTADYETALSAARRRKKEHLIEKERVYRESPKKKDDSEVGYMHLDRKGRIKSCEVYALKEPEIEGKDFTSEYFYIPHPFKPLDLVRMLDDPYDKNRKGIVRFISTQKDKRSYAGIGFDYSENAIALEWVDENGDFGHDHVNPLRLEYCGSAMGEPVLRSALAVLDGSDYLQTFQMYVEDEKR